MLKKLVIVLAVVCCASVTNAGEITKGQTFLSIGLGASLPMGDFKDDVKTGILGSFGLEHWISPKMSIGLISNYRIYDITAEFDTLLGGPIAGVDVKENVAQFAGFGKYLLSYGSTAPYIKYAVGVYKQSFTISEGGVSIAVSSDESNLGVAGGLGIQKSGSGSIGFFVEGMYHKIFVENVNIAFVDVRGGINIRIGGG